MAAEGTDAESVGQWHCTFSMAAEGSDAESVGHLKLTGVPPWESPARKQLECTAELVAKDLVGLGIVEKRP